MLTLLFIGSCSPKPEIKPKPAAKVKSKKPAWTDGKIKSIDEWYGVSSGKVSDTLDLENAKEYGQYEFLDACKEMGIVKDL